MWTQNLISMRFKKIDTTSIKNRKNKEMRGTEYGMDQIS